MSWRESSDPRCPECGGKIAATASYCMHCQADLDGDADTSEDSVLSDDEFGGTEGGEMPSKDWDKPDVSESDDTGSTFGDTQDSVTGGDRHKLDGIAGRLTSILWTDVPDPEGVPESNFTAPLWMRLPVGVVSGFFVYFVFLIDVGILLSAVPGPITGLIGFFGFFVIMVWLVKKPLPSDIIGDASYATALLLYSMPVVYAVNEFMKLGLGGSGITPADIAIFAVIIAIGTGIPATILLVIGYAGNRYARSKLDRKAEESTDSTTA